METCTICGSTKVDLIRNGFPFCLSCYNKSMAKAYGHQEIREISPLVIKDSRNLDHTFKLEGYSLGQEIQWGAFEELDESSQVNRQPFEFKIILDASISQDDAVKQLESIVKRNISKSSLKQTESPFYDATLLERENLHFSLNNTGFAYIKPTDDGTVNLIIDGFEITSDEFIKMLSRMKAYQFHWKFTDTWESL